MIAQQALGGFLDGAQIVLLARGQVALLQQAGEAEDAIERGADLVAHVGQELGLDAAGLQGLLARQVQLDVLDLDGLQVLPHVLGGLVDAVLQLLLGVLQRLGHAVDAGGQLVHLGVAQRRQAGLQLAFLELVDALLDAAQRIVDEAAHAQGEQGGDAEAGNDQQQAGEQAAVALQQGAMVGDFQLHPAQQAVGAFAAAFGGQALVAAEHRHQEARGVLPAAGGQRLDGSLRRLVEHARAGLGQRSAFSGEEADGAHILLVQRFLGQAPELVGILAGQGRCGQRGQVLDHQLATLVQLAAQLGQLHPGEVAAEHQCQQAGG